MKPKPTCFTDEEKALVEYLKSRLKSRGVEKYPRDWHLKQLSVARDMLSGETAPTVEQWEACMDWLFNDEFWGDKIDHLSRVLALWPKYVLRKNNKKAKPKRISHCGNRNLEELYGLD
jgi:hypothetical protein